MMLGEPKFLIFPTFVGGFLRKCVFGPFWAYFSFWAIFGPFLGHFWAVFRGVQIFWSLNIIGGDHRPILFFIVFHFWAILGHFCQFWAVFHFGAFLHFRVVRGARGGVRGVRGGL